MSINTYLSANTSSIRFLLNALDDIAPDDYQRIAEPGFQSPVGAHYRHIIEHYQCFFSLLAADKTINYDLRERNLRLETDMAYAVECLNDILQELSEFSCDDKRQLNVSDDHCDYLIRSSLSRELMFLIGHSEHHSAMIAAMLRILGYEVDNQFGVANATLNHAKHGQKELSA